MNVPATLHTDLRDLLFADWGQVVTFREVSTTYNPAQAETAESTADTLLLAVLGPRRNTVEPNTGHQFPTHERAFLIRAEDLPADASFSSSRILHNGDEYTILSADLAPLTNVIAFITTRVTLPLAD